jgi:hypothetical protein
MHIAVLLTALIVKNTINKGRNMDCKLITITNFKICKTILLVVEYTILIRYYSHTANTRALYESIDGLAENPPNSDRLGYYHRTVPKLMVRVYWQPGMPIGQWLGLDPDPVPKWWSRTNANTWQGMEVGYSVNCLTCPWP